MPVAVQTIPEYLQSIPSITEDMLNDNRSLAVPDEIIEECFTPLRDSLLNELGITDCESIEFDPKIHLSFTEEDFQKTKRWTLEELQVTNPHQEPITDIGVTDAFPLFTDEAIAIMRYEILKKETLSYAARYASHSNSDDISLYLRGYCDKFTPFSWAAWNHPETLKVISRMAGVELVNLFDYEVGHANISVRTQACANAAAAAAAEEEEEEAQEDDPEKMKGSVQWHYDSPQMVCVLMMSDTTNMKGGETALQMGNGKVVRVKGPKRGSAAVLQGRILKHIATQPGGNYTERITVVGSYRPADPMKENSFATTVRPSTISGSRYNDFYKDFMNYRLDVLKQRIDVLQNQLNESYEKGEHFDQLKTIDFIQKNIVNYAERSYQEFEAVEDGVVPKPASYNQVKSRWPK